MIEKITDNVYRAHRHDLRVNLTKVYEALRDEMMSDFSYIIVTKRSDGRINGNSKYIEGIDNDFRSHYLIVVKSLA